MSPFWCGYLAGLISVFLPSLVFLALIVRQAPDMTEAIEAVER